MNKDGIAFEKEREREIAGAFYGIWIWGYCAPGGCVFLQSISAAVVYMVYMRVRRRVIWGD